MRAGSCVCCMPEVEIFKTQDGSHSVLSQEFGVSYHSRYGAVQESRHVFIEAGLFFKAITTKELRILEIGLGTGLNAFLTLLEAERHQLRIHYQAIEAFPLSVEQARLLNYPEMLQAQDYQTQFLTLHECPWEVEAAITPSFHFKKCRQRFETIDEREQFDVIYFDAFAPEAQPELWDIPVLSRMYNALRSQGILVTYCAKGVVKRRMRSLGFEVETLPGPPGKREMIRCVKKNLPPE